MATAQEVVEKFQAAIGKQDYAGARRLLQDDLTVEGPIESFHNADSYLDGVRRLAAILDRVDIKKIFADGNDVCLLYEMVTSIPAATVFIAEWYQVTDNKISSVRGVYDPQPFVRMAR